jgi:hypothetical protein
MAELAFERIDLALEVTRGTAVTPPTHNLLMEGLITPTDEIYLDQTRAGTLAMTNRSERVRSAAALSATGALDNWKLPVLCEMALESGVTPSTPGGGTTTRLWEYVRDVLTDSVESATVYSGDPNAQTYQSKFFMLTNLNISGDASGTDAPQMGIEGIGQTMTAVATPTLPAITQSPLMIAAKMQLWIDTATIGTTAITGRVVSANINIPVGVQPKYLAVGPTGGITYSRIGRERVSPTMTVVFDLVDQTQYDNFADADLLKVRVRFNGPLLEGTLYNYVEVDMYGRFSAMDWGELAGTNRTISLTLTGEYDATLGSDVRVAIQNNKATL